MASSHDRRAFLTLLLLWAAAAAGAGPARADDSPDLDFLREEAQVVSASRRSHELARAPATVYVVTGRRLRESGAQTLWEALRGLPGVDVMTTRSMQGEVSIRGFDGPLNNRTLVLLDGKTVLNGFYDFAVWESIPVSLDEIDRIEVVEGPVSALYGPNAVNGVIDIITKKPEAVGPAQASVTAGEDGLLLGSAMTGARKGPWSYKLDAGWRSADAFEQKGLASQAMLAHGLVGRDLGRAGSLELSGGINDHQTRFAASVVGAPQDEGDSGFLRADWRRGQTKARAFWNYGRTEFEQIEPVTALDYDTYDLELEQGFQPLDSHRSVVGAEFRRNASRSSLYGPAWPSHAQDLWAAFFEDDWALTDALSLDVNGRLDHHPLAGYRFSPRGSVVWSPVPQQTLRVSGGSAFRYPTLVENYIDLTQTVSGAQSTEQGASGIGPEQMTQAELAYLGVFSRLRARASLFEYRVDNLIIFGAPQQVSASPAAFVSRAVNQGGARVWGGEVQLEAPLPARLSAQAAWSYALAKDASDDQADAERTPRNKVSGSLAWRRAGWRAFAQAFWQSRTGFQSNPQTQPFIEMESLPDYWLLNARLAYAFSGRWAGLEAALSAWNLLDRRHYELTAFQNGELLGRRVAGTLSYRLP